MNLILSLAYYTKVNNSKSNRPNVGTSKWSIVSLALEFVLKIRSTFSFEKVSFYHHRNKILIK